MSENNTNDLIDSSVEKNEAEKIEDLKVQYKVLFGNNVPNNKKNDIEWIKSKIDQLNSENKLGGNDDKTSETEEENLQPKEKEKEKVDEKKNLQPKEKGKTKIKLITDVFYNGKKYKEGTELDLEFEELSKFAESFYKKI